MKANKYIEIVRSTTPGLSSMSQESCSAIYAALAKQFTRVEVTLVNNLADLEALVDAGPDLVFLGMEFITVNSGLDVVDSDKIWLSEYFDEHDIAYTGSGQVAHEFQRNKQLAKQRVMDAGLSSAAFHVIKQDQALVESDVSLSYPLFVKPSNLGGGIGINSQSVVHNFEQLKSRVDFIASQYGSDSLIEEYLSGREFSVAILKDSYSKEFMVMAIELIAPADINGDRLLSGQVKSSNTEEVLEVTDGILRTQINMLALASFEALGARDYGRIDIRLDSQDIPYFLEANLIPSLISGYGSFPKSCALNIGLEYEPMINMIAELGLERNLNDVLDIPEPIVIEGAPIILGAA